MGSREAKMAQASPLPYTQLSGSPRREAVFSTDLYRNPTLIGTEEKGRGGPVLTVVMMCLCLAVCLVVLVLAPATKPNKIFDIIGEVDDGHLVGAHNNQPHLQGEDDVDYVRPGLDGMEQGHLNNRPVIGILSQ